MATAQHTEDTLKANPSQLPGLHGSSVLAQIHSMIVKAASGNKQPSRKLGRRIFA